MKTLAKWMGIAFALVLIIAGTFYGWASMNVNRRLAAKHDYPPLNITQLVADADIELGKRIVTVRLDCISCHGADLGGKAFMDNPPMGKYYGSNLTPHALKGKSDEEIARAIYYGVRGSGAPLVFMPSNEYHNLSVGDIAAMVAYLRSLPPVARANEASQPGPLATVLGALGKMPVLIATELIDKKAPPVSKPEEQVSVEFGQYQVAASCAGCHGEDLRGGPVPGGDPAWPPATDLRRTGIGTWTEEQFITTMRTGVNPQGRASAEPMRGVFELTRQLNDVELKAMWAYLRTQE